MYSVMLTCPVSLLLFFHEFLFETYSDCFICLQSCYSGVFSSLMCVFASL